MTYSLYSHLFRYAFQSTLTRLLFPAVPTRATGLDDWKDNICCFNFTKFYSTFQATVAARLFVRQFTRKWTTAKNPNSTLTLQSRRIGSKIFFFQVKNDCTCRTKHLLDKSHQKIMILRKKIFDNFWAPRGLLGVPHISASRPKLKNRLDRSK